MKEVRCHQRLLPSLASFAAGTESSISLWYRSISSSVELNILILCQHTVYLVLHCHHQNLMSWHHSFARWHHAAAIHTVVDHMQPHKCTTILIERGRIAICFLGQKLFRQQWGPTILLKIWKCTGAHVVLTRRFLLSIHNGTLHRQSTQ